MLVAGPGRSCLILLVAASVVASASSARAQAGAGEITGIVTDQGGASVPGATVTVTNLETNRQRRVISTGDGVYAAPGLLPGAYRVDVEVQGFKSLQRTGIRLSTGEKARVDFKLEVGDLRQHV